MTKWVLIKCRICKGAVTRVRVELAGSARAVCASCIKKVAEARELIERGEDEDNHNS